MYRQEWVNMLVKEVRQNRDFSQRTIETARWAREQVKRQTGRSKRMREFADFLGPRCYEEAALQDRAPSSKASLGYFEDPEAALEHDGFWRNNDPYDENFPKLLYTYPNNTDTTEGGLSGGGQPFQMA